MSTSPNHSPALAEPHGENGHTSPKLWLLTLGALGVVYGDIGTSPLYALRECFDGPHAMAGTHDNLLGILSLIFWSLIIVISGKYLSLVMRADNRGEGGILALMALVIRRGSDNAIRRRILIALAIFGASLLYGDGVITPAITVLSAVEGLEVLAPALKPYVLPITITILAGLFLLQRRGTGGIGAIFGPYMIAWFTTLAVLGIVSIARTPHVLAALNPYHAATFFIRNGVHGFLVLGSIFLVVTGGESLYIDMGHFGAKPIRLAWTWVVLPALVLNYFGQGALLLRVPTAASNPFFLLAPDWALVPLVLLATGASVVASQAVISGAFSLMRQAVQLGYAPRVNIVHTSASEIGQIYIPFVNWALFVGVIALVLGFRTSTQLASAYGIAVASTMVITTVLTYYVTRELWNWSMWKSMPLMGTLLVIDLSFYASNIVKVGDGGWFPLMLGAGAFTLMTTWKRGREILANRMKHGSMPVDLILNGFRSHPPNRVSGTAVFMTGNPEGVPTAMLHNLKHNKVLHERVILLTILNEEVPAIPGKNRLEIHPVEMNIVRLIARYGFTENPSIPEILMRAKDKGVEIKLMETTFFLGRETLIPSKRPGMALWREALFAWMTRNARSATAFYNIPPNRVVELGAQIEL